MKLTSLKHEDKLVKDLESLIKRYAKKEDNDESYVRNSIAFLCNHRQRVLDDLHEESMREAHDAIWGEGR
jgi:DNA-binding ferritin-like protein